MSRLAKTTQIVIGGLCTIGTGCAAANLLPNSMLMDELKNVVQMYRYGEGVPISEKVSGIVKTVMDDMQLNSEIRERIQPFTVYGFDTYYAGSTHTKYGAILGIPPNFYYSSIDDVDVDNITVQNRQVNWLSDAGKSFRKSLVISESAQKFLIAREIAAINTSGIFYKTLNPLLAVSVACVAAYRFDRKLNFAQRPLILIGIVHSLICLFSLGLWAFLQDFSTIQIEINADKVACALGEEYIRGGVEAYSKLLQRNISLRELMGSKGTNEYTCVGNTVYFIRQKHLPITTRKEYLETLLPQPKAEKEADVSKQAAASAV